MLTECRNSVGGRKTVKAIAFALVSFVPLHMPISHADESWKIVVPWRPPLVTVDIPVLFAQELSQVFALPVVIDEASYNKQEDALTWSLAVAPTQPSLVLFSEELALLNAEDRANPRHISHYEPMMLIWQTRWCLFGLKDSKLHKPGALKDWIANDKETHKVAIPEGKGRLSIWVRGLEQHTRSKWQVHTYGLTGSFIDVLEDGVDVAVSYCNRQKLHPDKTQILAQSGPTRSEMLPEVPLFAEIGWAPLAKGWTGWMTPKGIPVAQREKMAEALYRVMGKAEVQAQLRRTGHVVQHVDAQMAKRHIETYEKVWGRIDELLGQED